MTTLTPTGLRRGLSHYGDPDVALYLRRSFARAMGYGEAMLERRVIGITDTLSGFNNCHRGVPELIEATKTRRVNLRDRRRVATFRSPYLGDGHCAGALGGCPRIEISLDNEMLW